MKKSHSNSSCRRNEKMFSNVGFHAHFCFQRLTFLSPYVMLTESRSAVNYEFFWVVCMGVLLCSSLLFLLQTCILVFSLQEVLQPHESNKKKKTSRSVTPLQLENKPCPMKNAFWWTLNLSGVQLRVTGVVSRSTIKYGLGHYPPPISGMSLHSISFVLFFRGIASKKIAQSCCLLRKWKTWSVLVYCDKDNITSPSFLSVPFKQRHFPKGLTNRYKVLLF